MFPIRCLRCPHAAWLTSVWTYSSHNKQRNAYCVSHFILSNNMWVSCISSVERKICEDIDYDKAGNALSILLCGAGLKVDNHAVYLLIYLFIYFNTCGCQKKQPKNAVLPDVPWECHLRETGIGTIQHFLQPWYCRKASRAKDKPISNPLHCWMARASLACSCGQLNEQYRKYSDPLKQLN